MKKIHLILAFFLVLRAGAQTYDEKISSVRKQYYEIENNISDYILKDYVYSPDTNYPPAAYYKFWYTADGHLAKAQKAMGEEGYYDEENYYFNSGELIFAFFHFEEPVWTDDGKMNQDVMESRIYFYKEEIFEYLTKFADSEEGKDISEIQNKKYVWDEEDTNSFLESAAEIIDFSVKSE